MIAGRLALRIWRKKYSLKPKRQQENFTIPLTIIFSMTESKLIKTLTDYGNLSVKGAKKYWCGEQVGSGCFRDVYELKHDPRYVVKLIYKNDVFDNIKE